MPAAILQCLVRQHRIFGSATTMQRSPTDRAWHRSGRQACSNVLNRSRSRYDGSLRTWHKLADPISQGCPSRASRRGGVQHERWFLA